MPARVRDNLDTPLREPVRGKLRRLQGAPHGAGNDCDLTRIQRWAVEAISETLSQSSALLDSEVRQRGVMNAVVS